MNLIAATRAEGGLVLAKSKNVPLISQAENPECGTTLQSSKIAVDIVLFKLTSTSSSNSSTISLVDQPIRGRELVTDRHTQTLQNINLVLSPRELDKKKEKTNQNIVTRRPLLVPK